jgi:colicin import membrane protein
MRGALIGLFSTVVLAAAASMPTAGHALTTSQSFAAASKAKADAAAQAKTRAVARSRADALSAKARADAAAQAKAAASAKITVRAETRRRVDAADRAARLNRQVIASAMNGAPARAAKALAVPPHHGAQFGHARGAGHAQHAHAGRIGSAASHRR